MEKKKKYKSETLKAYRKTQLGFLALRGGMFASPLIPATVMTAVNWDEWFTKSGVSLPFGFASLLVTTILSVIVIWKKDDILNKAVSALFYFALLFAFFGITNLFLASLFEQVGFMFLATACGLVASGTCDQVNKSYVIPLRDEYKQLVETNILDRKSKRKEQRRLKAMRDAEEMRKRAVE